MRFSINCLAMSLLIFLAACSEEKPILELTEKYGMNGKKATLVLYKKGGKLIVPESAGRKSIDNEIFDVKENDSGAGDKLITFRLGNPEAPQLTFTGAFGAYGCDGCGLYDLSMEWVTIKHVKEKLP